MTSIQPRKHLSAERFDTPAILKKLALASRKLAELATSFTLPARERGTICL